MTDYIELIKDLRYDAGEGIRTLGTIMCEAADVIEALQAENERLKVERDHALQDSQHHSDKRLTLQTQLEAMQRQEPVSYQYRNANDDGTWGAWLGCDTPVQPNTWRQVRDLYATPKAPEPLMEDLKQAIESMIESYEANDLDGWEVALVKRRLKEACNGIRSQQ